MTKKKNLKKDSREVNVDGIMTYGKLDNNLNQASFAPCEHVEVPPFIGRFKVQRMNNGYLYLVELAKRIRNSPLFREDNSSLSHGKDKKFHFIFTMNEDLIEELPEELVRQALLIAQKVTRELLG